MYVYVEMYPCLYSKQSPFEAEYPATSSSSSSFNWTERMTPGAISIPHNSIWFGVLRLSLRFSFLPSLARYHLLNIAGWLSASSGFGFPLTKRREMFRCVGRMINTHTSTSREGCLNFHGIKSRVILRKKHIKQRRPGQ